MPETVHRTTSFTILPQEILDIITSNHELRRPDLRSLLYVDSTLHAFAVRRLYRNLDINGDFPEDPKDAPPLSTPQCIQLFKTLCRAPKLAALVHELNVDWSRNQPTAPLFRLLNSALRRLPALHALTLEFPNSTRGSLAWVFGGCAGRLRRFTTSARCDAGLARFLGAQPTVEDLCLRGFRAREPFQLAQDALPRLRALRAVHVGVDVVEEVLRGRPVDTVTLSLFSEDGGSAISVLAKSARPLRKVTIMTLECSDPAQMLNEIASTVPNLESLHIVILFNQYDTMTLTQVLDSAAPSLSKFKKLQYLTFMAGGFSGEGDDVGEAAIAAHWAEACPTLRTIILPQGKVWFQKDKVWSLL